MEKEKESECAILSEKLYDKEKELEQQKGFFEDKLEDRSSDQRMDDVTVQLKGDLNEKNDPISKNQDEITKLQISRPPKSWKPKQWTMMSALLRWTKGQRYRALNAKTNP